MSVTVTAVPTTYLLISGIIRLVVAGGVMAGGVGIGAGAYLNNELKDFQDNNNKVNHFNDINEEMKSILNKQKENITKEDLEKLISKEYQTTFVDKDLLMKTLEEHGCENMDFSNGVITCSLENFKFEFYKDNTLEGEEKNAFRMKITTSCSDEELAQLIDDINSEYTMNTQEESYIKIKERLEQQGLRINEEEILEDDSIVLTVNIN